MRLPEHVLVRRGSLQTQAIPTPHCARFRPGRSSLLAVPGRLFAHCQLRQAPVDRTCCVGCILVSYEARDWHKAGQVVDQSCFIGLIVAFGPHGTREGGPYFTRLSSVSPIPALGRDIKYNIPPTM